MITGQCENPSPVFSVSRENAAAELPLWRNSQLLPGPVLTGFSTGWALRLDGAAAQFTQLLEFRAIEAHNGIS